MLCMLSGVLFMVTVNDWCSVVVSLVNVGAGVRGTKGME